MIRAAPCQLAWREAMIMGLAAMPVAALVPLPHFAAFGGEVRKGVDRASPS